MRICLKILYVYTHMQKDFNDNFLRLSMTPKNKVHTLKIVEKSIPKSTFKHGHFYVVVQVLLPHQRVTLY